MISRVLCNEIYYFNFVDFISEDLKEELCICEEVEECFELYYVYI